MRISNNLPALTAFNSLNKINRALDKTIKALSTGLRINSASDDAAGFAISEKMRSQLSGLNMAIRNSQDGISFLQTAEGALGETNSMLQRMRELAVQASNDSLTSNDRQFLQLEIDELKKQIDRIADTTQFNKKRILDGSSGAIWSSSDRNVKAKINGGLTYTDQFGQKISAEGNYRIEVSAHGGQAQVQKSNIMKVAETETVTETIITNSNIETVKTFTETKVIKTEEKEISIIIDGGDNGEAISSVKEAVNLDEITSGWEYDSSTKKLTIKSDGVYRITGTSSLKPTQNHIEIAEGVNAQIFLDGVNIDTSSISNAPAFEVKQGAKAEIFLANTNRLKSSDGRAGIEVRGAVGDGEQNATAIINSAKSNNSSSVEGRLEVTGGYRAAAIGGPGNQSGISHGRSGIIEINGGTIVANGGQDAAGIGSGYVSGGKNGGGTININGGDVTAISPLDAGIGTGLAGASDANDDNDGTVITIKGGKIKAKGGGGAGAGIGGGLNFASGTINIKSGITVLTDEAMSNDAFLQKAENHTQKTSGDFVYAVKGASNTAAIGHGRSKLDTPGGVNLNANLDNPVYPDVPPLPTALVQEESIILKENVEYIKTGEDIEVENTTTTIKYKNLSEISQFYTPGGASIINPYKNLTITQGNGKTATVTLYSLDTMEDVAKKINDAIADDLGQAKYTNNKNKFCTIADGTENSSESIYEETPVYDGNGNLTGSEISATMLIRSAIPGKAGELYFSGDEDLLNALGLNTIQESQEAQYTASVYDAHTGTAVATNVKSSAPEFKSLIPPDIDIEVDLMAGLSANWDEGTKRFMTARKDVYTAMLHLKDNGTVFQVGANEGEDFIVQLGDFSSHALGVSSINIMTRETASRAISTIDSAISKLGSQRAKIGAYENALEHTMENLTVTSANLTNAESRIRDADMSKTMMNFVKYQILNQSGTSMLAQANQLPQSVLNLIQ